MNASGTISSLDFRRFKSECEPRSGDRAGIGGRSGLALVLGVSSYSGTTSRGVFANRVSGAGVYGLPVSSAVGADEVEELEVKETAE